MSRRSRTLSGLAAGWFVLPILFGLTPRTTLAQPPATLAPPVAAHEPVGALSLADCVQYALQRQPRIAAERAHLAAAEDGKRALDDLHIPEILDRELPIRRKQAALGVGAAAAGVDQAEHDAVYAVTRAYYAVVYAREQDRITRAVVERLTAIHNTVEQQLKAGARNVSAGDEQRALVYLRSAQARHLQAAQGEKRALAALKEAIGLGCDTKIDVVAGRLPDPTRNPVKDEIVAAALARRGDLVQAGVFAHVTCLEVDAQASSLLKRKETFAAGADIHASQVPQGVHNSEYHPGAVPPEMPTMFAGSRQERIKHAEDLHERAEAVVAVTHNLIVLEAEDAFLRWEQASQQVVEQREAADAGDQFADGLTRDITTDFKVRIDEVISARVLAAQTRATYNEYLYNKILALADLERITAGGFCAGLVESPLPKHQPGVTEVPSAK